MAKIEYSKEQQAEIDEARAMFKAAADRLTAAQKELDDAKNAYIIYAQTLKMAKEIR